MESVCGVVANRMQIHLSIERMTLSVLVIVLPRVESRTVVAPGGDVGSKAGILCVELTS